MGIHYSEFDEMFEMLKIDIPIPLNKAVDKWKKIKGDGEIMKNEWLEILEDRSREFMDQGYPASVAMSKAWNISYNLILEDFMLYHFSVSDLKDCFFKDSLDDLEKYEYSLLGESEDKEEETENRFCSKCGKVMYEGYAVDNGMEYYCSDECLYSEVTKEEWLELYEYGDSYWTEFEE